MAKVKIQGHASGSGVLTVTAPNTSSDRTITLPDETATLSTFDPDGAVTINDTGADVDFRVESDTKTHALFVDGETGNIGINESSPDSQVSIVGAGDNLSAISNNRDNYALGFRTASTTNYFANSIGWSETEADNITSAMGNYDAGTSGGPTGLWFATGDTSTLSERLRITNDGRGLSQFTAKAWINLDGTGTIAIRDSHNVSSITDVGSGSYGVTMSNAMANANYSVVASGGDFSGGGTGGNHWVSIGEATAQSTTAFYPRSLLDGGGWSDNDMINCIVFGD